MSGYDPESVYDRNELNLHIKDDLEQTYEIRKKRESLAKRAIAPAVIAPIIGAYALIKSGYVESDIETIATVYLASASSILGGVNRIVRSEELKAQAHLMAIDAKKICDEIGINHDAWIREELG